MVATITNGMRSKPRRKAWQPFWRGFGQFVQGREMGFLNHSRFRAVLGLIVFCMNLSCHYVNWLHHRGVAQPTRAREHGPIGSEACVAASLMHNCTVGATRREW